MSLAEALRADPRKIGLMSDDQLRVLGAEVLKARKLDRIENQILYYEPVSPVAEAVHCSKVKYIATGGGNGASKTDTMLAQLTMMTTGVFSEKLKPHVLEALLSQFRGPIAVRVVVASATTTLFPIILPKLRYWNWQGADEPGGVRGHYGWIPRSALTNGSWTQSWFEKTRMLTVRCQDPKTGEYLGDSTWQFMSYGQEAPDFASGDFHWVLHDEAPPYAIWRENEARTMRVGGRMAVSFTWPDDPSIPVEWIYDEIYERGLPGPNKDPTVDWFEMWSFDNPNINQESVQAQAAKWSPEVRAARIYGRPIRFSHLVHPAFTDHERLWCKTCHETKTDTSGCERCGGEEKLIPYCHVTDFPVEPRLPTVFLLDPHPRKPHMGLWVQVDTWNDLWVVAEMVEPGGPEEVEAKVAEIEEEFHLHVAGRIGDRNMLSSPASTRRGVTWRDEFDAVGLYLDLSDVSDVGRGRLNDYLRMDPDNLRPRIHIHPRCTNCIRQLKRYIWDDFIRPEGKDLKQMPKTKEDDFPTLLKYLLNTEPTYEALQGGAGVIRTR